MPKMASKVVNCSSNAAISSMESRRLGFYKSGPDWRSGQRRILRTNGSLAGDLAATQFVVALSKSHLSTAYSA